MVGARPVFCDVDAHTCLMDSGSLESAITPRTKAVIPVHLFGNVADMDAILAVAARHGIRVVEDCAQAHGAVRDGRMAGTFGDVACFSFYPTKNLGAYGDGGLCYTRDPALGRAIREMRMYGFREGYYSHREGVNSRLDEVQAAILGVKLRHLPALLDARRDRAARYDRGLGAALERTPAERGVIHAYHLYVVKVDAREEVVRRLDAARIGWGIHYPAPIHLMSGYAFLGYRPGDLPVTEALAGRILSLPMYPELPEEAVDRVCAVLNGER
jgi:aminotransferase EvaB